VLALGAAIAACGSEPAAVDAGADAGPRGIVVVTFNTGTNPGMAHDAPPDDGYGSVEAAISDTHYGDSLAWRAVIEDVSAFLAELEPDVVAFQEIYDADECPGVPADARAGFVCETWTPGDPAVASAVLGAGYQVACHVGHSDKCIGVRRAFGSIRGCTLDYCAEGLAGSEIAGCGSGARVGRAIVDRTAGAPITFVNVHGTSGIAAADADCRVQQLSQVFVDLGIGDGPGANGERNVVLGDFNTDPGRLASSDPSAAFLVDRTSAGRFHFVTEVGRSATPTYAGALNIDHVISDAFTGGCWAAGISAGRPPPTDVVYFDHRPIVCHLLEP
jgi:hypothetical protein